MSKRSLAIKKVIIVICVSGLFSFQGIFDVHAEDAAIPVSVEQMKSALLRPDGWIAEWKGNGSGEIEFLFEDRGEKIVVKINNPAWNQSCERDVTVDSDAVRFDGCNYPGISLRYDPDDKAYPFKGESDTAHYKLREK